MSIKMPFLIYLLPLLKQYSTHILVVWVGFAAVWYSYHSGYEKAKTEQAQEIEQAKIIAREKEQTANDELQKINDDYLADIGYGVQPYTDGSMSTTSPRAAANPESTGCQRSRAYKDKVSLIHALDLIIKADRKMVNGN